VQGVRADQLVTQDPLDGVCHDDGAAASGHQRDAIDSLVGPYPQDRDAPGDRTAAEAVAPFELRVSSRREHVEALDVGDTHEPSPGRTVVWLSPP